MPLYDCMLLVKAHVTKEMITDLVGRVGKRVYQRKGVITDIKSFGTLELGYGIKKRDGRHFQGRLMQMTMMVPPTFNKELQYLNKEDRLLRWLVIKHRSDIVYGVEKMNDDDGSDDFRMFRDYKKVESDEDDDEEEEDDGEVVVE
ncbi:uncharacterized protein A4U43_C10F10830 [Asparagus officinalis]|uniref:Uncharacterized protein n=1 Tax=Asparagus officinalis TaxID=4686 RepID=A0A5P1E1X7_ASPOF|nr:uncharacterized protein LOC109825306 [Asparagus officinalis]ONK56622.1 uncharacterized protein A4U43_C10F10830 [Asparagus officinalis]